MRRLRELRPPVREPRFWATQALIAAIAGIHAGLSALGVLERFAGAYIIETSLFLIPLTYAAISYGVSGAAPTAIWVTLLSTPNWFLALDGAERAAVIVQTLIVDAVAVFIGSRVDAQREAHALAEQATRALEVSEAKYRGLFETAGEAILVYDGDSDVMECNSAACRLLELPIEEGRNRIRGELLPREISVALARASPEQQRAPEEILLRGSASGDVWVQLLCTSFDGEDGRVQVVLRDVSEQKRRQAGLESYAAHILRAQEAERKRIAQELHDDTIQALLLLCRKLDDSNVPRSRRKLATSDVLQEAHAYAESIVASVRSFARGLRPPTLEDLRLSAAIDRLVTELSARSAAECEFLVAGEDKRLSADAELGLFRIAQEALHNVEHHSSASRATVNLSITDDKAELLVEDNGKGFTMPERLDDLAKQQKLGILGMHERARMLGGSLVVRSTPDVGTRISAAIPRV